MTGVADLAEEIKGLRRGRGVHHVAIEHRVGPELRRVCQIPAGEDRSGIRARVVERLSRAAAALPAELSLSAAAALGLAAETNDLLQLQDRVSWLAGKLKRDVRTARRRIDEACGRLAEVLEVGSATVSAGRRGVGWYVERFHAVALLDGPEPLMVVERRVIVAERDGLEQVALGWSLRSGAGGTATDIGVRVLYGGTLGVLDQPVSSRIRIVLQLPRPLRVDERHEYSVMTTLPPGRGMQKHYAYVPTTRCDYFHLRVRFDPARAPERIRLVRDAFHRDLDERTVDGDELTVDRCGDLAVEFDEMLPGHSYGIQWE